MELIEVPNFANLPRNLKPCVVICAANFAVAEKIFKYDHPGAVVSRVYQCPTGKAYNYYFYFEVTNEVL